jgi:hypothetical protein
LWQRSWRKLVLPAKLGELLAAMTENLETHMQALDLTDQPHAEYDGEELVRIPANHSS